MIAMDEHENWFRFCKTGIDELAEKWCTARVKRWREVLSDDRGYLILLLLPPGKWPLEECVEADILAKPSHGSEHTRFSRTEAGFERQIPSVKGSQLVYYEGIVESVWATWFKTHERRPIRIPSISLLVTLISNEYDRFAVGLYQELSFEKAFAVLAMLNFKGVILERLRGDPIVTPWQDIVLRPVEVPIQKDDAMRAFRCALFKHLLRGIRFWDPTASVESLYEQLPKHMQQEDFAHFSPRRETT